MSMGTRPSARLAARALLFALVLLSADAVPEGAPLAARPEAVATLKELMDATVDPAADGIWDSVAIRSTRSGVEHRQPRNDEEWAALRRHAITLVEACNLIALPGRHAAPPATRPGLGELDPPMIERRIARQRTLFVALAKSLQVAALQSLAAIDRRDTEAIMRTGGEIDEACEACHVNFWYPHQP